jgi:hypothetical protein
MSKRRPSPPKKNMDPSRNPDGSLRSREEYERAMYELHNPRPILQGLSRSSTGLSMDLDRRRTRLPSEEDLRRIEEMQQPPPRSRSPQGISGMMSTTLARRRAIDAMIEKARQAQLAYYAMLERRYGAVRGDVDSYLVAMERHQYDMEKERKKQDKVAAGTMVEFQSAVEIEAMIRGLDDEVRERLHKATAAHQRADSHWREYDREKTRKEEAEIERLRQEADALRKEYESRQEHERRRREEEYRQFQERERRRREQEQEEERRYQEQERRQREQEWNQRQQQQQQQQYARAAHPRSPSPRRDAPESPKTALSRRYPVPDTRPAAFAVLGLPASATKTEIKKAYRHGAMILHPDKNIDNPDEATIRFQQLQQAYNLLNPQGGGRRRRNHIHHQHRHHKSRKTRRHHHHTRRRRQHKTYRRK